MSEETRQEDRTNADAALGKLEEASRILNSVVDTKDSVDPWTKVGHPLNAEIRQALLHITEAQTSLGYIVKR